MAQPRFTLPVQNVQAQGRQQENQPQPDQQDAQLCRPGAHPSRHRKGLPLPGRPLPLAQPQNHASQPQHTGRQEKWQWEQQRGAQAGERHGPRHVLPGEPPAVHPQHQRGKQQGKGRQAAPPISIRRSTFLRNRWYSRALSVWIGVAPAGAS